MVERGSWENPPLTSSPEKAAFIVVLRPIENWGHGTRRAASRLADAVAFAATVGHIRRGGEPREIWHRLCPALSEGKPGLVGAITGRAEAQVM